MTMQRCCSKKGCFTDNTINSKSSKKIHGYTLIELIAVIAIIGILTAIATPAMKGWSERSRFNSKYEEVKGLVSLALSTAIATSHPSYIVGSDNAEFGVADDGAAVQVVNRNPRIIYAFSDLNSDGVLTTDELIGYVDLEGRINSIIGAGNNADEDRLIFLPSGMVGAADVGNWAATLREPGNYNFTLCTELTANEF